MANTKIFPVSVFEDFPATFLARVEDLVSGVLITQASLASVTYKVFDLSGPFPDNYLFSGTVTISTSVSDTLKIDDRWKRDQIGFNFEHTLPGSTFPTGGAMLLLEYTFTPTGGVTQSYVLPFTIKVIPTRSVGSVAIPLGAGSGPFGGTG